jgi:hypothetical protein
MAWERPKNAEQLAEDIRDMTRDPVRFGAFIKSNPVRAALQSLWRQGTNACMDVRLVASYAIYATMRLDQENLDRQRESMNLELRVKELEKQLESIKSGSKPAKKAATRRRTQKASGE